MTEYSSKSGWHRGPRFHGAYRSDRPRCGGMILFIVMVIVGLLGMAGVTIVLNLSTENRAFFYENDHLQLEQVLLSGVEYLKAFCEKAPAEQLALGGPDDNPARFSRVTVSLPSSGETIGIFHIVAPSSGVGDGQEVRQYGLEAETAKLCLRDLILWEASGLVSAREALMQLPGMTEAVADAILDWIDPDENRRGFGAEADVYAARRLPYRPRNDLPVALEELLLVRGVERHLLLGGFSTSTRGGDAWARGSPLQPVEEATWARFITFFSGERNITSEGKPRINLNDPDLSRLHDRLTQEFPAELADFVVFLRQFGPISEGTTPAEENPQAAPRELPPDFSRPARFALRSIFDVLQVAVEVETPARDRVIVQSPLTADPDTLRELLPRWVDMTSTTGDRVVYGRIDILRAPRQVLLAIPGMDSAIADRILTLRRQEGLVEGRGGSALARLYAEGILSAQQLRQLGPFVTTWSDVWTADIVAEAVGGSPLRLRAQVTVDATIVPARQIYWKHMGTTAGP